MAKEEIQEQKYGILSWKVRFSKFCEGQDGFCGRDWLVSVVPNKY